jgi:hypothetical protein
MAIPLRGDVQIAARAFPLAANSQRGRETIKSTPNSSRTWKKVTRVKALVPGHLLRLFHCRKIKIRPYLPESEALLTFLNGLAPVMR